MINMLMTLSLGWRKMAPKTLTSMKFNINEDYK